MSKPTVRETLSWFLKLRSPLQKLLALTATIRVVFGLFAFDAALEALEALAKGRWWLVALNVAQVAFVMWVWSAVRVARDLLEGVGTALVVADEGVDRG